MNSNTKDKQGDKQGTQKSTRGFASMDAARQREIASQGGRAAHQKGTAHEFTSAEAREAGRKGGENSHGGRSQASRAANGTSSARTSPQADESHRSGREDATNEAGNKARANNRSNEDTDIGDTDGTRADTERLSAGNAN